MKNENNLSGTGDEREKEEEEEHPLSRILARHYKQTYVSLLYHFHLINSCYSVTLLLYYYVVAAWIFSFLR